jgi:hypothetical protein
MGIDVPLKDTCGLRERPCLGIRTCHHNIWVLSYLSHCCDLDQGSTSLSSPLVRDGWFHSLPEFGALGLLGRCSITWTISPTLFCSSYFRKICPGKPESLSTITGMEEAHHHTQLSLLLRCGVWEGGWPRTSILPISAPLVTRMTGMSHQHQAQWHAWTLTHTIKQGWDRRQRKSLDIAFQRRALPVTQVEVHICLSG